MEKPILVFDVDGVLYPNPSLLLESALREVNAPSAMMELVMSAGRIPRHFSDFKEGQNLIKKFEELYYRQDMSTVDKRRLRTYTKRHISCILSYNKKEVIEKKLNLSNLADCFDSIFTCDHVNTKKVTSFELIAKYYNVAVSDLVFITDTVSDILEAKKAGLKDIYAVVSNVDAYEVLMKHIDQDKIFQNFYEDKSFNN